jgi:hypothetical protein
MGRLRESLENGSFDLERTASYLDSLDHETRLAEVAELGRKAQARLFEAAASADPVRVEDIVPSSLGPLREVVHHGKNTLPAFTRFAKVFCRPDDGSKDGELWGYNRNGSLITTSVGPGYFVAYDYGSKEVLVDYLRVPPKHPAAWPPILSNGARLSRFVYYGTQDILRRVSKHVSIGRATRKGKNMDAWFVLCREDPRV